MMPVGTCPVSAYRPYIGITGAACIDSTTGTWEELFLFKGEPLDVVVQDRLQSRATPH